MPTATDKTAATLEELRERYFAAWERRDADEIARHHAPDGIFHLHAAAEPARGREAIRATFADMFAQWPDLGFETHRVIPHAGGWILEWTLTGTLARPVELHGAEIGNVGARIAVDTVDVVIVEDGLITEKHTYLDSVTLLSQITNEGGPA